MRKQIYVLTLAALCVAGTSVAQKGKNGKGKSKAKSNLDIVYDVQKDVPLNNSLQNGELFIQRDGFYKVELRNINKFLYTVKVDDKVLNADNASTEITNALFSDNNTTDILPLSTDGINENKINSTRPGLNATLEQYLGDNTDTAYAEKMGDKSDKIRVDLITASGLEMQSDRTNAINYYRFLVTLKTLRADIDKLEKTKAYYREMINILKTDNKTLDSLTMDRNNLTNTFFGENNILGLKLSFNTFRSSVDRSYDDAVTSYASIDKSSLKNIGVSEEAMKDLYGNMRSLKDRINSYNYLQLFEKITNIYNAFNAKNFNITEVVQIPESDKYQSCIKIAPNSMNKLSTYKKELKYTINVEGGYKVDFSSGFFFNFLVGDKSYHYDTTGVGNQGNYAFIRKDKNKNDYLPSIGFLVHVYKRTSKPTNYGGCFGISTKDAESLRYYLGGSLFLGTSDRFIINAGVAGGPATVLSGKYDVDKIYPFAGMSEEPPTQRVFKLGAFIGVSYNLTNKLSNRRNND